MRLTQQQWFIVARAVHFVAGMARDKRAKPILKLIGRDGRKAARKGVRPGPQIPRTATTNPSVWTRGPSRSSYAFRRRRGI